MRVILNSDDAWVKEFQKSLDKNQGYCPCAIEKTKETKCMCKEFRDQVKKGISGPCHCGLWVAVDDE